MRVEHVEVLVEERSLEAALRVLLPRLLGELTFEVYPYHCKDDLLKKLPDRLRGYRSWLPRNWRTVVVVDRDDDDCRKLKQRMERIAAGVGLITRSARRTAYQLVNRLAIDRMYND
jgi:hypothetical protein